jgi:hypothetical protein
MIYELRDVKTEQFWMGAALGVLTTLLVTLSFDKLLDTQVSTVEMPKDVIAAYNMGIKDALKTNPAGAELEMACLELWGKK